MRFRPCIDIHNGQVKQIVGGSIKDQGNQAKENFVSTMSARDYALLYKKHNCDGGHIILLNAADSEYYEADLKQAYDALQAYPGGMQIGGGINAENAKSMIEAGASHVIVTSYVFVDGEIRFDRLERLNQAVGANHIVLDLSCRKKDGDYYIVTNRWQKFTKHKLNREFLCEMSKYCDEFLIHAVDVEGTKTGLDKQLVEQLADFSEKRITYAGGIASMKDLETLENSGRGWVDFTVGSALDLFGGTLSFEEIVTKYSR